MAQKHENEGRGETRTQQAGSQQSAREEGSPREEGKGLARWEPFRELDLFRDLRLGRPFTTPFLSLFDELFGERATRGGRWMPAVDLCESDDAYTLTAELPGTKPEEVELEVKDNRLTIRGEKRCEREEKKERGHWVERGYGSFVRSFTLPADADVDRVDASFRDGVLTVRLPKTEVSKPKRIPIH